MCADWFRLIFSTCTTLNCDLTHLPVITLCTGQDLTQFIHQSPFVVICTSSLLLFMPLIIFLIIFFFLHASLSYRYESSLAKFNLLNILTFFFCAYEFFYIYMYILVNKLNLKRCLYWFNSEIYMYNVNIDFKYTGNLF